MAEGGGEADLFRTAKIGVFWNMELCSIPPAFSDVTQIAPQIKLALSILGYEGEVHIGAIGDTRKLKLNIIRDMRITGIVLEHSDSDEYPNHIQVMTHMCGWPMCNRGANILNISTDPRSLVGLCILSRNGFNILRVQQKSSGGDAKYLWDWSDILNVVSQPLEANPLLDSSGRADNNRDNPLLDSNGRAGNNRDGKDEYNMLKVHQKPSGFQAAAECSWDVGDGGLSLSQCSSVEPNLLHGSGARADKRDGKVRDVGPSPSQSSPVDPNLLRDSGGGADDNRDGKGGDVGPSLSQCPSVDPNLLRDTGGGADDNRDGKGRDAGPSLSQYSSVAPNLSCDSSAGADNNRDGKGQFGDYKGEQARKNPKQPNANTPCARQPQSGKKHRKSYQLLSKFIW